MSGPGSTRRTVTLIVAAALVAITCVALGIWQLARLQEKRELNASVRSGLSADPIQIGGALTDGGTGAELSYRRATATGRYDPEREVVLYGRTLGERAGNHLLTPLVLSDGSAIIVDRGWVPLELATPPVAAAAPPAGTVVVSGVLFPSEGDQPGSPSTGAGPRITTVSRADLSALQAELPYRIAPVYLLREDPTASAAELPRPAALPELTEGPHLSYAIQWFLFAAIALIGCAILVRRDRDERLASDCSRGGVGAE